MSLRIATKLNNIFTVTSCTICEDRFDAGEWLSHFYDGEKWLGYLCDDCRKHAEGLNIEELIHISAMREGEAKVYADQRKGIADLLSQAKSIPVENLAMDQLADSLFNE